MTLFKKILLSFRVSSLFIKRRAKWLILAAVLLILVSVVFLIFKDELQKQVISEGLVGTYTEGDLPPVVVNLLSQSLIVVNAQGMTEASLASSWQTNNDATVYTVKLKDNLYWSDGTKLYVSDIDFSLPDVGVRAIDDNTLEFKLADSFSPFPLLLTKPILKKGSRIGLGPYQIKSIQKDKIFVKKLVLYSPQKNMPNIIIRFYPNEKIAKSALKIGEIQSLLGISEFGGLDKEKTLRGISKPNYQQLVTIYYNTKDPLLSDENLRIALSFQAPSISDEVEAKTSIPPTSWAFNAEVRDYLDNNEQAKISLKKVGKLDRITLTATSSLKNVGEKVVEAWKKLGIDAVLRVESGIPQNFQALLIAQNIPLDPDQYSLWHSTQTQTNLTKYSSPRVDKDLEDGRKSADMEIRKLKYKDLQKVLLDHAPATFLYFPKYNIVYRKKIEVMLTKVIKIQLPQLFRE